MFRGKMRAFVILALSLMLAAAPVVAETTVEQRLADLETVRTGLEEGHYDLFALVTPDEWQASLGRRPKNCAMKTWTTAWPATPSSNS